MNERRGVQCEGKGRHGADGAGSIGRLNAQDLDAIRRAVGLEVAGLDLDLEAAGGICERECLVGAADIDADEHGCAADEIKQLDLDRVGEGALFAHAVDDWLQHVGDLVGQIGAAVAAARSGQVRIELRRAGDDDRGHANRESTAAVGRGIEHVGSLGAGA